MTRRKKMIIGAAGSALIAAMVGGGVTAASASGGGDDNATPITGPALEQASAAALAYTGGGKVTETEVGDEDGYYQVEVTTPDKAVVDVALDRDFTVTGAVADTETGPDDPADSEGPEDPTDDVAG
ncbi:PepSY domain-containing protein [Frankia sp. CcI49]|uniref:PepSY domain-containing protein n=1 Tax=Frankia sp. CcI49 TaxID=1745382 RepID=UPI000E2F5C6B|nr:PepSY domain-containing protein [Frankia sp. CcI49]